VISFGSTKLYPIPGRAYHELLKNLNGTKSKTKSKTKTLTTTKKVKKTPLQEFTYRAIHIAWCRLVLDGTDVDKLDLDSQRLTSCGWKSIVEIKKSIMDSKSFTRRDTNNEFKAYQDTMVQRSKWSSPRENSSRISHDEPSGTDDEPPSQRSTSSSLPSNAKRSEVIAFQSTSATVPSKSPAKVPSPAKGTLNVPIFNPMDYIPASQESCFGKLS
jgi:hypothetical protein